MPPPPRRPRPDPFLSGEVLDAEILDAQVLDAEVLDADVLDADVLDADVLDADILDASVIEAAPLPLEDDGDPVTFNLDDLDAAPQLAATKPDMELAPLGRGADLLILEADSPLREPDPLRPATRTAACPATAKRPAVRITFVCPGEASPFARR